MQKKECRTNSLGYDVSWASLIPDPVCTHAHTHSQANKSIAGMEQQMSALYESASLFEVNVPDYKQLKACR